MTTVNGNTSKTVVTRSSLFNIAAGAEEKLDHLTALIQASTEKLSNIRRSDSVTFLLAETDMTQTFLDAAGLYAKSLEDAIEAIYKQAWLIPETEDA